MAVRALFVSFRILFAWCHLKRRRGGIKSTFRKRSEPVANDKLVCTNKFLQNNQISRLEWLKFVGGVHDCMLAATNIAHKKLLNPSRKFSMTFEHLNCVCVCVRILDNFLWRQLSACSRNSRYGFVIDKSTVGLKDSPEKRPGGGRAVHAWKMKSVYTLWKLDSFSSYILCELNLFVVCCTLYTAGRN